MGIRQEKEAKADNLLEESLSELIEFYHQTEKLLERERTQNPPNNIVKGNSYITGEKWKTATRSPSPRNSLRRDTKVSITTGMFDADKEKLANLIHSHINMLYIHLSEPPKLLKKWIWIGTIKDFVGFRDVSKAEKAKSFEPFLCYLPKCYHESIFSIFSEVRNTLDKKTLFYILENLAASEKKKETDNLNTKVCHEVLLEIKNLVTEGNLLKEEVQKDSRIIVPSHDYELLPVSMVFYNDLQYSGLSELEFSSKKAVHEDLPYSIGTMLGIETLGNLYLKLFTRTLQDPPSQAQMDIREEVRSIKDPLTPFNFWLKLAERENGTRAEVIFDNRNFCSLSVIMPEVREFQKGEVLWLSFNGVFHNSSSVFKDLASLFFFGDCLTMVSGEYFYIIYPMGDTVVHQLALYDENVGKYLTEIWTDQFKPFLTLFPKLAKTKHHPENIVRLHLRSGERHVHRTVGIHTSFVKQWNEVQNKLTQEFQVAAGTGSLLSVKELEIKTIAGKYLEDSNMVGSEIQNFIDILNVSVQSTLLGTVGQEIEDEAVLNIGTQNKEKFLNAHKLIVNTVTTRTSRFVTDTQWYTAFLHKHVIASLPKLIEKKIATRNKDDYIRGDPCLSAIDYGSGGWICSYFRCLKQNSFGVLGHRLFLHVKDVENIDWHLVSETIGVFIANLINGSFIKKCGNVSEQQIKQIIFNFQERYYHPDSYSCSLRDKINLSVVADYVLKGVKVGSTNLSNFKALKETPGFDVAKVSGLQMWLLEQAHVIKVPKWFGDLLNDAEKKCKDPPRLLQEVCWGDIYPRILKNADHIGCEIVGALVSWALAAFPEESFKSQPVPTEDGKVSICRPIWICTTDFDRKLLALPENSGKVMNKSQFTLFGMMKWDTMQEKLGLSSPLNIKHVANNYEDINSSFFWHQLSLQTAQKYFENYEDINLLEGKLDVCVKSAGGKVLSVKFQPFCAITEADLEKQNICEALWDIGCLTTDEPIPFSCNKSIYRDCNESFILQHMCHVNANIQKASSENLLCLREYFLKEEVLRSLDEKIAKILLNLPLLEGGNCILDCCIITNSNLAAQFKEFGMLVFSIHESPFSFFYQRGFQETVSEVDVVERFSDKISLQCESSIDLLLLTTAAGISQQQEVDRLSSIKLYFKGTMSLNEFWKSDDPIVSLISKACPGKVQCKMFSNSVLADNIAYSKLTACLKTTDTVSTFVELLEKLEGPLERFRLFELDKEANAPRIDILAPECMIAFSRKLKYFLEQESHIFQNASVTQNWVQRLKRCRIFPTISGFQRMCDVYLKQRTGLLVDQTDAPIFNEGVPMELECLFATEPPIELVVAQIETLCHRFEGGNSLISCHIERWVCLHEFINNRLDERSELVDRLKRCRCCFGATEKLLDYPCKFSMNRVLDTATHYRIHDKLHQFKNVWRLLGVNQKAIDNSEQLPPKDDLREKLRRDTGGRRVHIAETDTGSEQGISFHDHLWRIYTNGENKKKRENGTYCDLIFHAQKLYPRETWQCVWDFIYETPRDKVKDPNLEFYPTIVELSRELGIKYLEKYYEALMEDNSMPAFPSHHVASTIALPLYWNLKDSHATEVQRVRLKSSDQVYLKIQTMMQKTLCGNGCSNTFQHIQWIERIENSTLWKQFCRERESIKDKWMQHHAVSLNTPTNDRKTSFDPLSPSLPSHLQDLTKVNGLERNLNEVYLYHGTDESLVETIAEKEGFDERVSKRGVYGCGIYAAENPCKSNMYTNQGYIFITRAILGNPWYVKNSSECNNNNRPDDPVNQHSLVTNTAETHREFVIFDRKQLYPEFLIKYKK